MDLQPGRQFDYLQRTLSIFLSNPSDMSAQFEVLIDELIKENKQLIKSPKNSPESSSSDSKSESTTTTTTATSPSQSQSKKRSAPLLANPKPPPNKRLKSNPIKSDDDDNNNDDDDDEIQRKKKPISDEKRSTKNKDDDSNESDDDDNDEIKSKSAESQVNPSSTTRDMDEFAIELGLVCNKCKVLTEEKDNRLVECHECTLKYHQKCHKPPVSTADISDPRCLWYCSKCRKALNKRQSQSTIKEVKTNSNSLSSVNKSKTTTESTAKKGISTSITDVTPQLFSFKNKSSESTTSDNSTSSIASISTSNSSLTNGQSTVKNTNGWASLATGFKEKKSTNSESASSILSELVAITSGTNSNPTKSPSSNSFNTLLKQSINGGGSLKTTSLSSLKSAKPSSPPVLKPQLSTSSLKSTQKILPTNKNTQRVSSPTPLGRQPSVVKSPPTSTTATLNRLNSSGSHSPSSTNPKIPTNSDYEKRIKQIKKIAAEKSLTKRF